MSGGIYHIETVDISFLGSCLALKMEWTDSKRKTKGTFFPRGRNCNGKAQTLTGK